MTLLGLPVLIVVVLLGFGWWLSGIATRLDRAHVRVEGAWSALDAALVRRAARATEVVGDLDPATGLLVGAAAAEALEVDLDQPARERVGLARRLHNDAVATARTLRRRRLVRLLRLAGHADMPAPFEMTEN